MAFKDPCFGVAYGPSKYGKTTDLLYSVPNAYFFAAPGALKPSENVVGFVIPPEHVADPQTIPEATKLIGEVAKWKCKGCAGSGKKLGTVTVCPTCLGTGKRHNEIGVDDFSMLAERSASALEGKGLSGYKFWGALRDEILDFRDAARRAGMHVLMNCHEVNPQVKNGAAVRGGPKLPGKLPEELPAACDLVVRASIQSNGAAASLLGGPAEKLGWVGCYRCSPKDTGYISGDRHGVTPDFAPMNLGEILRAAGYVVHRAPGLEWMEKAVAAVANVLLQGGGANDTANLKGAAQWLVNEMATQAVYQTPEAQQRNLLGLHVRWIMRDAYDRTLIQRARMNPLNIFGL